MAQVTNSIVKSILDRINFTYNMPSQWIDTFITYCTNILNQQSEKSTNKFNYEGYLITNAPLLREKFFTENKDVLSSKITKEFNQQFYISSYPRINMTNEMIRNLKFIHEKIFIPIAEKLDIIDSNLYLESASIMNSRMNPTGYINPDFKCGNAIQFSLSTINARELFSLLKNKTIDVPIGVCMTIDNSIYIRKPSYVEDCIIKDWFFESYDHQLENLRMV